MKMGGSSDANVTAAARKEQKKKRKKKIEIISFPRTQVYIGMYTSIIVVVEWILISVYESYF